MQQDWRKEILAREIYTRLMHAIVFVRLVSWRRRITSRKRGWRFATL